MNKWILLGLVAGVIFVRQAGAAEWIPIKWGDNSVRQIDTSSVKRNGSLVTFIARHSFANSTEYTVGRSETKYLLISSRANCSSRTLAQLATEAYDEKMVLISKQQIQMPEDSPVTPDSIDESELNFICTNAGQKAK